MFAPATRALYGVGTAVMDAEKPELLKLPEPIATIMAELPESETTDGGTPRLMPHTRHGAIGPDGQ